jgi:chemotaxis protein MotB
VSHGGDDDFPEEHEEHVNHEAWVIPYADLLTLLMAMFIALFAISNVDQGKFQALARGFSNALGGGKLDAGIGGSGKATSPVVGGGNGNGPFNGGTITPSENTQQVSSQTIQQILSQLAAQSTAKVQAHQQLQDLQSQINKAAKSLGLGGKVHTKVLNNGLEVTLLTDHILFDSGQSDLKPGGADLLSLIGAVLKTVNNPIQITGFTDSFDIKTERFHNNWELSGDRASAVLQFFIGMGINPEQLTAAGRGPLDPVASNATPAGRALNRRVEIVVESKLVKQTLDANGLNNQPASPTTVPVANPTGSTKTIGATPNLNPGLGAG